MKLINWAVRSCLRFDHRVSTVDSSTRSVLRRPKVRVVGLEACSGDSFFPLTTGLHTPDSRLLPFSKGASGRWVSVGVVKLCNGRASPFVSGRFRAESSASAPGGGAGG